METHKLTIINQSEKLYSKGSVDVEGGGWVEKVSVKKVFKLRRRRNLEMLISVFQIYAVIDNKFLISIRIVREVLINSLK